MNRQSTPKASGGGRKQMKVDLPGAAPAMGPAPKRFRSGSPLSPGAASTRDYNKAAATTALAGNSTSRLGGI